MIITLIGSARYERTFDEAMSLLTLQGHVVIGLGLRPSLIRGSEEERQAFEDSAAGDILDMVHLQKIQLCDQVVWIDNDDYAGVSTTREILWSNFSMCCIWLSLSMVSLTKLRKSAIASSANASSSRRCSSV